MKQLLILVVCGILAAGSTDLLAKTKPGTWNGILGDKACAAKMKGDMTKCAGHTKMCATEPMCAKSGYGLTVDGTFYKFDKKGDAMAAKWLASTKKDKDLEVTVTGTMNGKMIKVTDIKDKM
ncbi:MAG: hypothetical protein JSS75_11170 [Bacteroidetes bacterium]|nr:hypothetical protein [Bacteroidota bacterium]